MWNKKDKKKEATLFCWYIPLSISIMKIVNATSEIPGMTREEVRDSLKVN